MLNRLRLKLKSCRGASILMALLFLLVCMLVASSVLMAAASNSGKLRSNQQEQQKYLALSSALRLVCDELTAAEYTGQYEYSITPHVIYDEENHPSIDYYIHTYTQVMGRFDCELTEGGLAGLLPLQADLDAWLAANFKLPLNLQQPPDVYNFNGLNATFGGSYQLLVQPNVDGLSQVNISLKMRNDGIIRLTATLGEAAADGYLYTMEAELVPQESLNKQLRLEANPQTGLNQTGTVKWDLNWIAKKEAAGT